MSESQGAEVLNQAPNSANVNPDDNQAAQQGVEESQQEEQKLPNSFEKRINKMYGENRRLSEQNSQLSQRLQYLESVAKNYMQPQQQTQDSGPRAPRREDYADPFEYADARIEYERKKIFQDAEANQRQQMETQRQRYQRQVEMSHNQRFQEALNKYDDMVEALENMGYSDYDESNPVHQEVLRTMQELHNSGEVAYYFAKHKDEFNSLFHMNPKAALLKLGSISNKVESSLEKVNVPGRAPVEPVHLEKASSSVSESKEDFKELYQRLHNRRK